MQWSRCQWHNFNISTNDFVVRKLLEKSKIHSYKRPFFPGKFVFLYFLPIWSQLLQCIQSPLLTKWHVKPIFPVVMKWQLAFREDAFKRCMKKLQFRMLAESIIEWERIWEKVTSLVLWNKLHTNKTFELKHNHFAFLQKSSLKKWQTKSLKGKNGSWYCLSQEIPFPSYKENF